MDPSLPPFLVHQSLPLEKSKDDEEERMSKQSEFERKAVGSVLFLSLTSQLHFLHLCLIINVCEFLGSLRAAAASGGGSDREGACTGSGT